MDGKIFPNFFVQIFFKEYTENLPQIFFQGMNKKISLSNGWKTSQKIGEIQRGQVGPWLPLPHMYMCKNFNY